jgi:hypothetical protein
VVCFASESFQIWAVKVSLIVDQYILYKVVVVNITYMVSTEIGIWS